MKVWRIPQDQLEKLGEWQKRLKSWDRGFALIEQLTGKRPKSLSQAGDMCFVPADDYEVPACFTKPNKWGGISPKRNHPEGRRLLKAWEESKIPSSTTFDFLCLLGIPWDGGPFSYKRETIGGQVYLIQAKGWNPEEFGYEPVEI